MKTIVTHNSPDQDAITAVWLIKRFFPDWQDAKVEFVPAGKTLNGNPPDQDPAVIHVDTGLSRFDHHASGDKKICAATKVFDWIKQQGWIEQKLTVKALERMMEIVRAVDHAEEKSWPEPVSDRYEFMLETIFDGLKSGKFRRDNSAVVEFGLTALDGILTATKEKITAETEIENGIKFDSRFGKAIGIETASYAAHRLAERVGFAVVAVKDIRHGGVRIYAHPAVKKADLTFAYEAVLKLDPGAEWFLHASKRLLLNRSRSNPDMKPTKLSLPQVINILKKN